MDAFSTHVGRTVPLRRSSVDTDQIIPARFVKRTTRHGYRDALFANLREDPGFILNDPAYENASILIAGADFGIGSSREQAVWALQDYGFRVVIAPSFGDIFRSNASNTGLLTAVVPAAQLDELWNLLNATPDLELHVDLGARTVATRDGSWHSDIEVPEAARRRLLNGMDAIDETLARSDSIRVFEKNRSALKPVVRIDEVRDRPQAHRL